MMESMRLQKILQDDITDRYLKFVDILRTYQSNPALDISTLEKNLIHITDPEKSFNKRALILENSNMISKVLAGTLNENGYHSSFAFDGYVAIGRLVNEKFDFLVTSYQTSTIDGASLINSLRVIKGPNQNIPAALITSSDFAGFNIVHDNNHILHKEDNLIGQFLELIS
jgi:CheY-like chemotaxis protein